MRYELSVRINSVMTPTEEASDLMLKVTDDLGTMFKETFEQLNEANVLKGAEITFKGGVINDGNLPDGMAELIKDFMEGDDAAKPKEAFAASGDENPFAELKKALRADLKKRGYEQKKDGAGADDLQRIDERMTDAYDEQIKAIGSEYKDDEYIRGLYNGMEIIRAARANRPIRFMLPVK